jgi:hypothetical protein
MPPATVSACLETIIIIVVLMNVVATVYMTAIVLLMLSNATAGGEASQWPTRIHMSRGGTAKPCMSYMSKLSFSTIVAMTIVLSILVKST